MIESVSDSLFYRSDYAKSQLDELSKAWNRKLTFEIDSYQILKRMEMIPMC